MGAGEVFYWVVVAAAFAAVIGVYAPRRRAASVSVSYAHGERAAAFGAISFGAHAAALNALPATALRPAKVQRAAVLPAAAGKVCRVGAGEMLEQAGPTLSLSRDQMLALIVLCDESPQEGLARIDTLDAQTQRQPMVRFARVVALRRLIWGSPEEFERRYGEDVDAFLRTIGSREVELAARALSEIGEIEHEEPDFFDDEWANAVVNTICIIIEPKRPASVQKALGWTRIFFFGTQRILALKEENPITEQLNDVPEDAMIAMIRTRFSCAPIVRLAVAVSGRRTADGWVVLFGLFAREAVPRGGKLSDAGLVGFLTVSERGRWRFDGPTSSSVSFAFADNGLRKAVTLPALMQADASRSELSRSDLGRIEGLLEKIDGRLSGGFSGDDAARALNKANTNLERVISELRDISRKLK